MGKRLTFTCNILGLGPRMTGPPNPFGINYSWIVRGVVKRQLDIYKNVLKLPSEKAKQKNHSLLLFTQEEITKNQNTRSPKGLLHNPDTECMRENYVVEIM